MAEATIDYPRGVTFEEVWAALKETDRQIIERMEKLRKWVEPKGDTRRYQGAIAGAIMSDALRAHILENGFYAIEQTGDTVQVSVPEGNAVREW